MPTAVHLVKVGMSMTEGVVEEWYIPDGAQVKVGELLYRLETEKVNLDVDAEAAGTVKHLVSEGVTMEPGDVVGYIFAEGESVPDQLTSEEGATAGPAIASMKTEEAPGETVQLSVVPERIPGERIFSSPAARRLAAELAVDISVVGGSGPGGRIVEADVRRAKSNGVQGAPVPAIASSPVARKLARELDIDLNQVAGTGPGGRVTKIDVEQAANVSAPATTAPGTQNVSGAVAAGSTVPIRGMRKTIAARMHESLQTMAQLTMDMDVVMDDAIKLRNQLVQEWADQGVKPTYTDLVIRAVSKALIDHPLMNASWGDKEIALHGHVSVGMAVALDEGLIVPVVKNSNLLDMRSLAIETARLAEAARNSALGVDELQGGTFTVSALGMFGVDSFTPIINSPQAGILGVNRIRDDLAWDGERPVKRQTMRLSLTWDHRVLDGAPAAKFLACVRDYLEAPFRLLV